mgnify:CR=1 FL=1
MKKFIVFEGIDGSGKSTQLRLLAKSLEIRGLKFFCTREPGGSYVSELIRKILVKRQKENILPLTELLLIYAARNEHLKKKIVPNLKNRIVLCDRYFYSTYCYQILTSNIPLSILKYLHSKVTNNLMPDLTLVIDIDFEIGIKRSLKKGERVELRGFGVFSSKIQKARISRNPKTNEKINTPEKKTINFKMSKDLFKILNNEKK